MDIFGPNCFRLKTFTWVFQNSSGFCNDFSDVDSFKIKMIIISKNLQTVGHKPQKISTFLSPPRVYDEFEVRRIFYVDIFISSSTDRKIYQSIIYYYLMIYAIKKFLR